MTVRILAALAVLVLAGCTATPRPAPSAPTPAADAPAASAPAWTEPAAYRFVLARGCQGKPADGRYQVSVAGGRVVEASRIDGRTAAGEEEIDVPTLGELLDMARTAAEDGAAVSTTLDRADGHPTAVTIDVTGDGGDCFTVTDYTVTG